MSLSIRQIAADARLHEHLAWEGLTRVLTPALVEQVVEQCQVREQRRRKLPAAVLLVFCIAMNVFADDALDHVFFRLVHGLRWLWSNRTNLRVTKGALCQGRYRLGARPVVALFHRLCRPLAGPQTRGAFVLGYRFVAIDSQTLDLPDTPANARGLGRPSTDRGPGAFPQARLLGLVECGTHAFLDAGVWPYAVNQHAAARRLTRSVQSQMLVSYDAGLHSHALLAAVQIRGAHVLARLPVQVRPRFLRTLPDGTSLARIWPMTGWYRRERAIVVRIIVYTFDDPQRPGHGEQHRLLTTLLDPDAAPAAELVMAYHHRWEYELTVDEVETHLRPRLPLRSQRPLGVIQEVYGLLLAHYLVRAVIVDAAHSADLAPTQLSFLSTLRLLRATLPDFQHTAPTDHPRLYQALLAEIVAAKLRPRANRLNPRVVKRKMSNFDVKRASHRHWPQPTKTFRATIVLLN